MIRNNVIKVTETTTYLSVLFPVNKIGYDEIQWFFIKPLAFNLEISSSCEIQSKAFDGSGSTAAEPLFYLRFSKVFLSSIKDIAVSQTFS